ncbi:uncharacterized protein [Rutidosis leptorrhynchoides]|uniref:uncharacterized protein n=1 Tax=Rutidosis leptorrhynchoides TaxID=125765 RepID=UPI003A9977B4
MSDKPQYHPALTVTNIKNFIPIVLETDKSQYTTWSELFKIHCRAYEVIDHIIPAEANSSQSATTDASTTQQQTPSWSRLDSIVLQWIYGTISPGLLTTVLVKDSTAATAWERLRTIF